MFSTNISVDTRIKEGYIIFCNYALKTAAVNNVAYIICSDRVLYIK